MWFVPLCSRVSERQACLALETSPFVAKHPTAQKMDRANGLILSRVKAIL
jgi:hypothetical protein